MIILEGFYKHTDGGYYFVKYQGKDSKDGSPVVVYEHIWPFECDIWVRPQAEWESRFTLVSMEEICALNSKDKEAARATITAAKKARKDKKQ